MASNFGIVTFDNAGPIKTWAKLAAVATHNSRANVEPHCDPSAPQPVHLCGTKDLISDVKDRLREHGIDPARLRKNAAMAFEAIMTASRAFFTAGTEQERGSRTGRWIGEAVKFAEKTWGKNRIVSMVLHLDEHTPHIHVVVLPLLRKVYKRWPERGETWALVGRTISGPGMYQQVHDAYAAAMAPLGLVRGVERSRAKHRPYAAELASLEEAKAHAAAAAAEAKAAADHALQDDARRRAAWFDEFTRQEAEKAALEARETKLAAAEKAAQRAATDNRKAMLRLELDERQSLQRSAAIDRDRRAAVAHRENAKAQLIRLTRALQSLGAVADQAERFRAEMQSVPPISLPPAAVETLRAVSDFETAAKLVDLPAADIAALPLDVQAKFGVLRSWGRAGAASR